MRGRRQKTRRRSLLHPPAPSAPRHAPSRGNTLRAHGATNKSHHVCARRRDGKAAGTVSDRDDADARRSFAAVEWHDSDRLLSGRQRGDEIEQALLFLKQQRLEHDPEFPGRSPTHFSKVDQDHRTVITRMEFQVQRLAGLDDGPA
jgi:hypothetical protein